MLYTFLRIFIAPTALVLWIAYQLLIKKKKWAALQSDALLVAGFAAGWALLYFALLR